MKAPYILRSPEIEEELLRRMADGESLRSICRSDGMPDRITVWRWIVDDQEFATKCGKASTMRADSIADDIAELEEGVLTGTVPVDAARVVISSKQWRAAKYNKARYGDRVAVGGADDMPGIKVQLDANDAARRIAFLLTKATQD